MYINYPISTPTPDPSLTHVWLQEIKNLQDNTWKYNTEGSAETKIKWNNNVLISTDLICIILIVNIFYKENIQDTINLE